MPTALFSPNRGREPGTSARYSIRRAAGDMARIPAGPIPRRRPPQAAHHEDRISALSDDLLLCFLRNIDTHTALGAGTLSRRWAHLPRQLPDLDFRVGDILSPRYHQWLLAGKGSIQYGSHSMEKEIRPNIQRFERRAMRSLVRSMESFLDAADDGRRLNRLRLEFFTTHNTGCINTLLAKAIDAWGAVSLEVVAKPIHWERKVHTFPSHGLCEEPRASRLRSLKLGGCVLPPLHEYSALTTLVLQDMPLSTPEAAYEGVFTSCPQLQVLHLISCFCEDQIVVDAPRSQIRELVLDNCEFIRLCMRALPCLERLASLGTTRVLFESASFPCLTEYNLTLDIGADLGEFGHRIVKILNAQLGLFFRHTMDITNLVIRFTGPGRWIVPSSSPATFLPNLRRLLVADVPSFWDVSWPRLLLETAPSLHTLHVHIAPSLEEPDDEILWQPTMLRHDHLKEFVMLGFQATERQIYLVKFVVGVCTGLCHVALLKDGHVRDKGHWDWEIVTQQHSWTDEEKGVMLNQIMDGVSSSSIAPGQLVFG